MKLERYEYSASNSFLNYEFYSIGPNGKIKKLIAFEPYEINKRIFFSLAFGDDMEETGEINVMAISDNKDTEKIFGTLFSALLDLYDAFLFARKW